MIKSFTLLCILLACFSCTRIDYLGNSLTPTQQVDVYVEPSSIQRPYTVIGKGYVNTRMYGRRTMGQIQSKSVAKAREKGADGILIQDFYTNIPASMNTVAHTDSFGKGTLTVGTTSVHAGSEQQFTVLFIKYK